MATVTSPKSPPHHHTRRRTTSSRRSSGLPSTINSPRTALPRDTNAFAYNSNHLSEWAVPDSLWVLLPQSLREAVTSLQHAGAAVQTSFERLDELQRDLPQLTLEDHDDEKEESVHHQTSRTLEDKTSQDVITAKLDLLQRQSSQTARKDQEEKFDCSRVPPEHRPIYPETASFSSDTSTRTNNTTGSCPSPLSLSHSPLDVALPSPLSLGMAARRGSSVASPITAPPKDPRVRKYLTELDQLKKVDIIRLRHATQNVDTEWRVVSKSPTPISPISPTKTLTIDATVTSLGLEEAFQTWWPEKKNQAQNLEQKGSGAGSGFGYNYKLGWGEGAIMED